MQRGKTFFWCVAAAVVLYFSFQYGTEQLQRLSAASDPHPVLHVAAQPPLAVATRFVQGTCPDAALAARFLAGVDARMREAKLEPGMASVERERSYAKSGRAVAIIKEAMIDCLVEAFTSEEIMAFETPAQYEIRDLKVRLGAWQQAARDRMQPALVKLQAE
jgi:hypothetical protein